jgi:hypothetical protein
MHCQKFLRSYLLQGRPEILTSNFNGPIKQSTTKTNQHQQREYHNHGRKPFNFKNSFLAVSLLGGIGFASYKLFEEHWRGLEFPAVLAFTKKDLRGRRAQFNFIADVVRSFVFMIMY